MYSEMKILHNRAVKTTLAR